MIHLCFRIFNFHFSIGQSISYRPVWNEDRSKKRKERMRDNKENNKEAPSFKIYSMKIASFFHSFFFFSGKYESFVSLSLNFEKSKFLISNLI